MPLDDAIRFIYKDFTNKTKKIPHNVYQHPDAIQTLLKNLAENRALTVLQYDHMIKYLTSRREIQRKAEIGEDTCGLDFTPDNELSYAERRLARASGPTLSANTQDDLQKKIMEILNKKPMMQQIAKKVEVKPKPMTQGEKDDLKHKLMQDDKIKQAMLALRNSKKLSK
jgi:hypothetical protein